jgi:hypothetical protein
VKIAFGLVNRAFSIGDIGYAISECLQNRYLSWLFGGCMYRRFFKGFSVFNSTAWRRPDRSAGPVRVLKKGGLDGCR